MPQSLTKVYVHLVFSTKYREPTIGDDVKDELYAYLGGVCQALECHPVRIGGYYDHIHILCILSKKTEAKSRDLPVGEGVAQAQNYAQLLGLDTSYTTNGADDATPSGL